MPEDASLALVHALLERVPRDSNPVVAVIKAEPGSPSPGKPPLQQGASSYDPSAIYLLELASMIAIDNTSNGDAISKDVVEVLQDVVRSSSALHPLLVSRAAFYLLHVLHANYVSQASLHGLYKG